MAADLEWLVEKAGHGQGWSWRSAKGRGKLHDLAEVQHYERELELQQIIERETVDPLLVMLCDPHVRVRQRAVSCKEQTWHEFAHTLQKPRKVNGQLQRGSLAPLTPNLSSAEIVSNRLEYALEQAGIAKVTIERREFVAQAMEFCQNQGVGKRKSRKSQRCIVLRQGVDGLGNLYAFSVKFPDGSRFSVGF